MNKFPPLRMAVLTGLVELKGTIDTLNDPDCPYDDETKATLRQLLAPEIKEVIVEKEVQAPAEKRGRGRPSKDIELSQEDKELVNKEIKSLIEALNAMGTGEGLAMNERIQLTKTKAGLVDQMLKMRERNVTAQRMEEFKEQVIKILDELVSEKDRDIFLKRLEPFR